MVEIAVKIFAFRLDFFKSKMEVFDAIIVVVSFVLDIVYASAEGVESAVGLIIILRLWRVTRILNGRSAIPTNYTQRPPTEKLVIKRFRHRSISDEERLRNWTTANIKNTPPSCTIVRTFLIYLFYFFSGIIMSVKIQAEKRLARERRCREALEQELLKYREYCTAQENEIEALQGLLRKHGIEFERVERPVVGSTIDVVAEVNEFSEKVKMMDQDDFNPPSV